MTNAEDDFPYSPALHTESKHCFDDVQTPPSLLLTSDITAVNNYMMSAYTPRPFLFQGSHK